MIVNIDVKKTRRDEPERQFHRTRLFYGISSPPARECNGRNKITLNSQGCIWIAGLSDRRKHNFLAVDQ